MGRKELERQRSKESGDKNEGGEKLLKESQENKEKLPQDKNGAAQRHVDQNLPKADDVIDTREKPERVEYDASGEPSKYTDRNGDVIEKRDGAWFRTNLMYPQGEQLQDFHVEKDGTVSITYRVQKDENNPGAGFDFVKKDVRMDGSEKTSYNTSGDGSQTGFQKTDTMTEMTGNGDEKTVRVFTSEGKEVQTLKYRGSELVEFVAPDKTTYKQETDEQGKAVWRKYSADGKVDESFSGDKFAVRADSNGAVIVRNAQLENKTAEQGGAEYATRFLPDGSTVTSTSIRNDGSRVVKKANGEVGEEPHRTVVQEMPENWKELLEQRRAEARNHPYRAPYYYDALTFIKEKTQDKGDWDDKQMGGQYQAWGNVAWGVYASEMGFKYEESLWFNGYVKSNSDKGNKDWGSPWDVIDPTKPNTTYGQNPADAELIRKGYDYAEQLQRQEYAERRQREQREFEAKSFPEKMVDVQIKKVDEELQRLADLLESWRKPFEIRERMRRTA